MKIGIIVYSQTGNTLQVAERVKESLIKSGNHVSIDEIKATRENQNIKIDKYPDINKYEGVIFATFTEAFSLCPVMKKYLKEINSENKKIAGFVTQHFPFPWMGGNRALKQMKMIISSTGNELIKTAVINWSNNKREEMIEKLANDLVIYYK